MIARALVAAAAASMLWAGPATAAGTPAAPTTEPPHTPSAHAFGGLRAVGALFPPNSPIHICTASVVSSPRLDLLLTAAHCVSGSGRGYVFDPGYRDGEAPLGSWTVVAAYAAPGWLSTQSARRDFAFLVVAPERRRGHEEEIQSVTGANPIAGGPASGQPISVPAYEAGEGGGPITCDTRVYDFGDYRAFNCSPYVGGTSGAPWLHRSGREWTVVGLIGGLHQGGCYPWTSYSPVFGRALLRTEALADNRGPPSTLPAPGPDGCG